MPTVTTTANAIAKQVGRTVTTTASAVLKTPVTTRTLTTTASAVLAKLFPTNPVTVTTTGSTVLVRATPLIVVTTASAVLKGTVLLTTYADSILAYGPTAGQQTYSQFRARTTKR